MNYRYLSLLTAGHLVTDVNQGVLIPALFFFAMSRDVTLSTLLLVPMGLATVFLPPNRFHEIIFQLHEAFQLILTTREKNGGLPVIRNADAIRGYKDNTAGRITITIPLLRFFKSFSFFCS